jgi:hypothetical protein
MGYNETYESKYIVYAIFLILFQVHVVQFRITFDIHVEIYLICKK